MKKTLLLAILLSLFYPLASFGQIQRQIWGLELGISTEQDAVNILTQKGLEIKHENGKIVAMGAIRFGGFDWKAIQASFKDGKLLSVYFINILTNTYSEQEIFNRRWETLKMKLKRKYSEYLSKEDTEEKTIFFDDDNTKIMLSYSTSTSYFGLCYIDRKLYNAQSDEEDDEL